MVLHIAQCWAGPTVAGHRSAKHNAAPCLSVPNSIKRSISRSPKFAQSLLPRQQTRRCCIPVSLSYSGNNGFGPVGKCFLVCHFRYCALTGASVHIVRAGGDAQIKVIGVGGGGGNAINRMIASGLQVRIPADCGNAEHCWLCYVIPWCTAGSGILGCKHRCSGT